MYTHRALVTYANEHTGEIRVKVPAVTGKAELAVSYIGRHKFNNIWVVPEIGEQIAVSADDEELTNLFWVHTDGYKYTQNYRNYATFFDTTDQTIATAGQSKAVTFNNYPEELRKGITLVDNSKITFEYAGHYNLQFSIQWLNTDTKINESVVWLKYKGADYPLSATFTSIPGKHGSKNGKAVTTVTFIGEAEENGYVQLYWGADSNLVSIHTIEYTGTGETASMPASPNAPGIILAVLQIA